jgi:hypothetical protein
MGSRAERDPTFISARLPRLQNTIESGRDQAAEAPKATTTAPTVLMFPVQKVTTTGPAVRIFPAPVAVVGGLVDERGATSRLMFHQKAITTVRAALISLTSNSLRRRKIVRSVIGRPKRVSLNAET